MFNLSLDLETAGVFTGAAFTPAQLFVPLQAGVWYDPSDASTLWQDSARTTPVTAHGDPVGCIDDKSGNGKHAIQATAAARPLYQADATGKYLLFDGVDDRLTSAALTLPQPFERYSALRQITWTASDRIFNEASGTNGILYQANATPQILLFGGAGAASNSNAAVGANFVARERWDGASSQLQVNNTTATTGNPGATGLTLGVSIGGSGSGGNCGNIRCYGMLTRAPLTAAEQASMKDYMAGKAGVTL